MSLRSLLLVLHVLGAVVALGFSLSYAPWIRRGDVEGPEERAFALRTVSWIDRRITTPAYALQLVTGLLLVATLDWDLLRAAWLELSLGLYVALILLAITVYAPAFRRQRALAERIAAGEGGESEYAAAASTARAWGVVVTAMTLTILVLMVWKPALWN
ncbi:MAG: DUF2269 family protein [Actinomycetota bacterium]